MGQDYRLTSIYEQMLRGGNTKQASEEQPKNLTEAYKKTLVERTAFYAKDIGTSDDIPNIQGLENLGAVEEPLKIKHTIQSLSVLPALEKAMSKEVSGWGSIKGVDSDKLARDFIAAGVSGNDLEKITDHKAELTSFQEHTMKPEVFNLSEVIVNDIKTKAGVEASSDSLALVFKRVFEEEGTIAGTAVGKGELAISLFTNASKGKTGDLKTPNGKTIEVKGTGGRLGPAEYSQANTSKELAQFLLNRKSQTGLNRELVKLKTSIRMFANKLEEEPRYSTIFNEKLKQVLNQIADNVERPTLFSFIDKYNLRTLYSSKSSSDKVWDDFDKMGFIISKAEDIPAAPLEKAYVKDVQSQIRKFLTEKIYQKGKLERILSKTVDAKTLANQTFTTAVQDFFLNDLGLTSDEAAEAFLFTKSYNKDVSKYLPEIKSFFQQHYNKMVQGNSTYLEAAVFAFQLALYAQAGEAGQHFDYFMIINSKSLNSLSLNVAKENLFTYLTQVYLQNTDKMKLSIRADGRQGASAVTLK